MPCIPKATPPIRPDHSRETRLHIPDRDGSGSRHRDPRRRVRRLWKFRNVATAYRDQRDRRLAYRCSFAISRGDAAIRRGLVTTSHYTAMRRHKFYVHSLRSFFLRSECRATVHGSKAKGEREPQSLGPPNRWHGE